MPVINVPELNPNGQITVDTTVNPVIFTLQTAQGVLVSGTNLIPTLPVTNPTKQFLRGDDSWAQVDYTSLTTVPTSFNPSAHATTHKTGGSDVIAIDTLGAATDNTNLNVSTSAHGLVPKAPSDTTKFLRGDGTWAITPPSSMPAGVLLDFAGPASGLPTGWLICDGSAVSRTTYGGLFTAIGTTYGAGNGTTTFNLPDCRGRVTVGVGTGTGLGIVWSLGEYFGFETHALAIAELPAHSHTISDPGHSHSISDPTHAHAVADPQHVHGISDPGHSHGIGATVQDIAAGGQAIGTVTLDAGVRYPTRASGTGIGIYAAATGIGIYGAATGVQVVARATGITGTNNTGTGTAFYTVQPSVAFNKIIKT